MNHSGDCVTREIANKIQQGDALTDEELTIAAEFYGRLAKDLYILGPRFDLAFFECNRIASELLGYQRARAER